MPRFQRRPSDPFPSTPTNNTWPGLKPFTSALALALAFLLFGPAPATAQNDEGTWEKLDTDGPSPRVGHTLVELNGDFILFGGVGPAETQGSGSSAQQQSETKRDLWSFPSELQEWSLINDQVPAPPDGPGPRRNHAVTTFIEGGIVKMLLHGGINQNNEVKGDIWTFSATSQAWSLIDDEPLPAKRSDHQMEVRDPGINEENEIINLHGGLNENGNPIRDNWEYDPAADTWEKKADFSFFPGYGAPSASYDGKIYVFAHDPINKDGVFIYDPETDTWTERDSQPDGVELPEDRIYPAMAQSGNTAWMFGGEDVNTGDIRPDIWALNLNKNKLQWDNQGEMPRPLTEATAALLLEEGNGKGAKQAGPPQILLFGGWDENGEARGETWVYTPPAPASPTGLQATAGNEQATLEWSSGASPAGYHVYRSTESFDDPDQATKVNDTVLADSSFTDTGIENDTTYHYRVTAANKAGTESGPSNETQVTPVLPVELARFTAEVEDRKAHLRWQTASETGSAGFEVQRRGPGAEAWQTLAFVESKAEGGTSSEPLSYRYVTDALSVGTHRFRLRQVDLDGSTDLSKVLSVRVRMETALRLGAPRPNPVSEEATLSFAVREQAKATVVLYDVLGQRVRTLYAGTPPPGESRRVRIDAGTLPSGTYVVRLEAGGQTTTRRLTVVR